MTPEERRHVLRDANDEDDWAWRRAIRANPTSRRIYRIAVFVVGLVLLLGGLALVPLPGPGWLIVIAGIAIWASEFEQAARARDQLARLKDAAFGAHGGDHLVPFPAA